VKTACQPLSFLPAAAVKVCLIDCNPRDDAGPTASSPSTNVFFPPLACDAVVLHFDEDDLLVSCEDEKVVVVGSEVVQSGVRTNVSGIAQ